MAVINEWQNVETDSSAPHREPMRSFDWIILSALALITGLWVVFLVTIVCSLLGI